MNKVLFIGGPTATGKSDIAVKLALKYNAIVIGADSMQIYRGMDIGTGKITEEEKCGIEHTMIDIVYPDKEYSVQNYVADAKKIIQRAHKNGVLPIVAGGTGLYINSLINNPNFAQTPPDKELRERYVKIAETNGALYLHELLAKRDKTAAQKIAVNDIKRTIRALEIIEQTGKTKTEIIRNEKCDYDVLFFVMDPDRQELYQRINARVDKMFEKGLIDEVRSLSAYWGCRSMQAIGYKETINALQNGIDFNSVCEEIKQNSRRYAKRQTTFFKWIQAEKQYVNENYYEHISAIADKWLQEDKTWI